jgi:hypothetical protein
MNIYNIQSIWLQEEVFAQLLWIFYVTLDWQENLMIVTGKSLSEALIFAPTNPQYDKRLFIDLPVQYMKTTSSEHVVHTNCFLFLFWHSEQFMHTTCSPHVLSL